MAEFRKAITRLMEERQERAVVAPAPPPPSPDPPPLRTLFDHLRPHLAGDARVIAEGFARELFTKAGATLLETVDVTQLAAFTVDAFRFVCARTPGTRAVRVYRPSLEREGWQTRHVVIQTALEDRPFIVDTLQDVIERAGGRIHLLLHPVLGAQRSAAGVLEWLGTPVGMRHRESFVHVEVTGIEPGEALERQLSERLRDVVAVSDDYAAMRERVAALAAELRTRPLPPPWNEDADEIAAFLDWLGQKSFVYLGWREYEVSGHGSARQVGVRPGRGLGICRSDDRSRYRTPQTLGAEERRALNEPPLVLITKTTAMSPVHRHAAMNAIAVKQVDVAGTVVGQRCLLGLFTSKAYHDEPSSVPLLRRKLAALIEQERLIEDTHDYRDFVGLFDSVPREELFASTTADLRAALRAIRAAEGDSRVTVLARVDTFRRGLFVTVVLPRARFSTELHQRVTVLLGRRLDATVLDAHLALDDRAQARVHYYLAGPRVTVDVPDRTALAAELNALLRTWEDQLQLLLASAHGASEAERLAVKYRAAFPAAYRAATDPADAVHDVHALERLAATGTAQIEFRRERAGDAAPVALRLYLAGERLVLSDFIPILENLGLRVLREAVVELGTPESACIHSFLVEPSSGDDLLAAAPRLVAALEALRAGQAADDRLNRLVLRAGLDWRAVDVLRAYVEHARQLGVAASRGAPIDALTTQPDSAQRLIAYFQAKFDPAAGPPAVEARRERAAAAEQAFFTGLAGVESLAHDRLLRALGAAVAATVRTNVYAPPADGPEAGAVVLKFDSSRLPSVPPPRPYVETYVHSVHTEGIHLRGGPVARGGLRFSDRADDLRTEILGLMKTQTVKNAVIVPVGAKGGFVVKRRAAVGPETFEAIDLAYRTFVGGLLSITDNVVDGAVVTPRGVIAWDGPDPYLVVAADKGTATFSDTANAVAARYGFWLGDAFASGGSHGYDHRQIGITARGVWQCVRRHFREMGRDIDREPVTAIGIGSMSGDVFGNGLLQSRTLRLRAAFGHQDIFLDPDPDPEASFRERERLFRLPRSTWHDYDRALISAGGGVFSRSAKQIVLTPPVQAMLGVEAETLTGEELVQAILRMDADLLWNGGIGTYVKASDESHAEVGDPANDAVRVDARELRVKVVAEGGNLGLTQRARIEFALAGGRINTDAIDNSAGVDLSDHEVNLKIALQEPVASHRLTQPERNALIAALTEPVCEAVLAHNRGQARVLSLDQVRSQVEMVAFRELMTHLEATAGLDRRLEGLPSREALRARRGAYRGLTRPELAVLLAYAKLDLQHALLRSTVVADPAAGRFLERYFPTGVRERFAAPIQHHRLRAEITAVEITNWLVDSMGMTFVSRIVRQTGSDAAAVIRAWLVAVLASRSDELLDALEPGRAAWSPEAEAACLLALERALGRATLWVLRAHPAADAVDTRVGRLREPVRILLFAWKDLLEGPALERRRAAIERFTGLGVERTLAERIVQLDALPDALAIADLAAELTAELAVAGEAYVRLGELIDLDWIAATAADAAGDDRWEQRAVAGLQEQLVAARRALARDVLNRYSGGLAVDDCLRAYAAAHAPQLAALAALIRDLRAASRVSLAGLLVVLHELGRLVARW